MTRPRGTSMASLLPRAHDPHSLDPRVFDLYDDGSPFSVVEAMRSRYQFFADATAKGSGTEDVTISGCPQDVRDSLDAVRARTFQGASPGIFALAFGTLDHGLKALAGEEAGLEGHPAVEALRAANQSLVEANWPDRHTRRVALECARAAYKDTAAPGGPTSRWSIRLPEDCWRDVGGLASDLGISKSATAVLCLQVTLANQPEELEDQRVEYAETVAAFLQRVRLRADITEALVKKLTCKKVRVAAAVKKAG